MRKSFLLCSAIGLLAAVWPPLVFAQFQPPNPDELKMTSDPKAPGADAVYLDIEEVANDPLHYRTTYVRIKVLTEKGKELATVELPYLEGVAKIADIKGRTIHPDGTVIPLAVKPEDLMISKTSEQQIEKKVFTLPSVEVGSILEYRYDLEYGDNWFSSPQWDIQRPYFVHEAHYRFISTFPTILMDDRGRLLTSLLWRGRVPVSVAVKETAKGYFLDLTDIPPVPDEEWMPPIESLLYKVNFYYSYARDSTRFWFEEVKLWSKDVDKFAEASKPIKAAVDSLIAPSDTYVEKARKLYDAVQALDNTDFSRKKSATELKQLKVKEAKNAAQTWAQKSGSREDIAMLYLAMLRAAGLTAYAAKVVDRDQGLFDPSYLDLGQLDSTVVILSDGGNQIIFDPGERMCPFGTVNWRHSDAVGIGQSAQGASFLTTPAQEYSDNTITRIGDLTVDSQGGTEGVIRIVMTGQEALRWRQEALRNDEVEVKRKFDRELEGIVPEGVDAHVDHFLSMSDPYANLIAVLKVKREAGTATPKRLILPAFFFETRGHTPFVNEEHRLTSVDMHYGERVSDEVTYHLSPGLTVEGTVKDANISWTGRAMLEVKTAMQPGQITVAQTLTRAFTLAKPEEYKDLRGFYQKVAAADQGQLVFTVPANQKGF